MIIAIDLSLRSTGLTKFDDTGSLIDFKIVHYDTKDDIQLLQENSSAIISFINGITDKYPDKIIIEGLSFMATSSKKDLLWGNYWHLRVKLKEMFTHAQQIIVPVTRWRKMILTKERVEELKNQLGIVKIVRNKKGVERKKIEMPSGWQKEETLRNLDVITRNKFEEYIKQNRLHKKYIFDLTDSYFIGKWYLSENNS